MSKYFIGLAHFAIRSIYFHFINFQFITVRFKIQRYSCVCVCVRLYVSVFAARVWVLWMDSVCRSLRHRPRSPFFEEGTEYPKVSADRSSVSMASLQRAPGENERERERRERGLRYALDAITAANRRFQVKDPTRHSKQHPQPSGRIPVY